MRTPINNVVVRVGTIFLRMAAVVTLAVITSSCASSSSVKSTWKAPDYTGAPPQKVAVLANEDRMLVRVALENRYVNQLTKAGQPAMATAESLPDLAAARQNKDAAKAKLRADGADALLITHLVTRADYMAKAHQQFTGQYVALTVAPTSDGWDTDLGSYAAYSSGPRSDDRSYLLLETGLYELQTGRRIWACLTETTVKETSDRLEIADEYVATVVAAMRKDGVVR